MIPLSVLDLVPVREGGTLSEAFVSAASLAHAAENAGYKRFWVAEHHAMDGIAGGATAFVIAEQFGTLDALFPGRIDLGLGRAPGADSRIGQALRKDLMRVAEYFPQDVVELRALVTGEPDLGLRATPGLGAAIEFWILGSSLFGAQLAAALGMPYAFASHFAPDHLDAALKLYRERFTPSPALDKPHVMAAMTVLTAETDAEAVLLSSSLEQSFVALRSGTPGRLKPPIPGYRESLPPGMQGMLAHTRQASAVGAPATVREAIGRFVERTQADEIIVSGATYDPAAREHSLALTMEALAG